MQAAGMSTGFRADGKEEVGQHLENRSWEHNLVLGGHKVGVDRLRGHAPLVSIEHRVELVEELDLAEGGHGNSVTRPHTQTPRTQKPTAHLECPRMRLLRNGVERVAGLDVKGRVVLPLVGVPVLP